MFNKVAEYHRNPWPSIDRNMYPNLISIWKREFLDNAAKVFSKGDEIKNTIEEVEKEKEELFKQIGRLKVENDWLKKKVL